MPCFLDERRLRHGPWQAFERDVARLLMHRGFDDVRIVGGAGDKGADVLGVKDNQLWVIQCKHTTNSTAPAAAVSEVANAGVFYKADRMLVASSRRIGKGVTAEIDRQRTLGVKVEPLDSAVLLKLADLATEYPKSRRELRPYQLDAVKLFREALIETGRGQVVLATGLGKTIVMAETVSDLLRDGLIPEGKVLVLADKKDLVDQLILGFWSQLPKWVPTHRLGASEKPTFWDGITFATVDSIRSLADKLPRFGLVLVDEAHHIGSLTFRNAIDTLDPPMLGGATATPWRGDGFDIDEILGPAVVKKGIADGLKEGFLCEVDYRLMADDLDWSYIQGLSHNNYSLRQLNRRLIIPTRDEECAFLIRETFDQERRRSGIAFSPTVQHAQSFSSNLRQMGFKSEPLHSEMAPRERDRMLASFRRGDLDFVVTVDLFNEGVDVPDVDLLVFMRVTHSRRIFVQQLGRGLRASPNKDKVVVMDFVTDLRRISEVVELEKAASKGSVERLPLGPKIVQFRNESAGSFMVEWLKDQADLASREEDANLTLPEFDFPEPPSGMGTVQ